MSNDGTGLRERLQHYADYGYHIKHGEEWGTFIPKVGSGNFWDTLTKAITALSAVAPPVATAERIADSLMMDAVTDKWSGRDAIVAAVRKALAASPAAPAQPEGGDADGYTAYGEFRWACDCDERMRAEWTPVWTRPAPAQQAVTDEIVREWRDRNGLNIGFADAACAIDDARSLHMLASTAAKAAEGAK